MFKFVFAKAPLPNTEVLYRDGLCAEANQQAFTLPWHYIFIFRDTYFFLVVIQQ